MTFVRGRKAAAFKGRILLVLRILLVAILAFLLLAGGRSDVSLPLAFLALIALLELGAAGLPPETPLPASCSGPARARAPPSH